MVDKIKENKVKPLIINNEFTIINNTKYDSRIILKDKRSKFRCLFRLCQKSTDIDKNDNQLVLPITPYETKSVKHKKPEFRSITQINIEGKWSTVQTGHQKQGDFIEIKEDGVKYLQVVFIFVLYTK